MFGALWYALLISKRFNAVIPHPNLSVSAGLILIGIPAMSGFAYAFFPTFLVIILFKNILHKAFLGPLLFDNWRGNAYYFGDLTEMVKQTTQQGRMGLSYTLLGIFIIISAANVTNPLEENEKKTVRKKNLWRRSQILYWTIIFIFFQTIMITISRTPAYRADIQIYSLGMKVTGALFLAFLDRAIPDRLSTAPYRMCQETIIKTMSMGTVAFTQFMVNYVMLVIFASGAQLSSPLVVALTPKIEEHFKKYAGIVKKLQNLWAVDDDEGDKTQKVKTEANDLTKLTKIIDHQYQNSTATVSQMFTIPVAILVILFSDFLKVESMYGQKDLFITIVFGIVIFVFQVVVDAFVENILEFAFAMKIHNYLKNMRAKFYNRQKRWILDEKFEDVDPEWGDENEPTAHQFRVEQSPFLKIHQMCFSEQFYFLVSLVTLGQIITVYAMYMLYESLAERPRYYPFDDMLGIVLIFIVVMVCYMVKQVIFKLGQFSGTWGLKGKKKQIWTKPVIEEVLSDEEIDLNAEKHKDPAKQNNKKLDRSQRTLGKKSVHTVVVNFEDEMKPGPQDALVPREFDVELQHLFFTEINYPHSLLDKMESLVNRTIRLNNSRIHGKKMAWTRNYNVICKKESYADHPVESLPLESNKILGVFSAEKAFTETSEMPTKLITINKSLKWPVELNMKYNL